MSAKRKICVVTGARADYGLLYWLMTEVAADPELQLQVIATGMHLSPKFGLTYQQIEEDGFAIDARVEMLLSSDSPVGITKSIGMGVLGFSDALDRLRPDILVVLGDRFEVLAAAQAALIARVPIAHIHGGEATEGAFDESIRHAVTKMAQWHFVAAGAYRKRVIQMGEAPERVFDFGAPGLDALTGLKWLDRAQLEAALGMSLGHPLFLVTYHPVTLKAESPALGMAEVLAGVGEFPDATAVLTHPNSDTGGHALSDCIDAWVAERPGRAKAFVSLGQLRYLSLMRQADVVIGNSSSGLTEAPALKKASVNVGDRQKGRLKASSVIDAAEDRTDITSAIEKALSDEFRVTVDGTVSLYGCGGVGPRIKDQLKQVELGVEKHFFDIGHEF